MRASITIIIISTPRAVTVTVTVVVTVTLRSTPVLKVLQLRPDLPHRQVCRASIHMFVQEKHLSWVEVRRECGCVQRTEVVFTAETGEGEWTQRSRLE